MSALRLRRLQTGSRVRALRPRGFTLIEALIASSLLLGGLSGVALLSMSSALNAGQSIEADNAAKYAALLVEEQVAVGFALLPAAGTSTATTQTFGSGKTAAGQVDIIDTSGVAAAGSPNLGQPSRLVRSTVTWTSTRGTVKTVVNETYVSQ